MTIAKLRILADTTFEGYPDKSIERFVRDALDEYDALSELFRKLIYSKIISDSTLLADPEVYNQMVDIFNKSILESQDLERKESMTPTMSIPYGEENSKSS